MNTKLLEVQHNAISDDKMPYVRNVAQDDNYKALLMSYSCLLLTCFCMYRTPCPHPSG